MVLKGGYRSPIRLPKGTPDNGVRSREAPAFTPGELSRHLFLRALPQNGRPAMERVGTAAAGVKRPVRQDARDGRMTPGTTARSGHLGLVQLASDLSERLATPPRGEDAAHRPRGRWIHLHDAVLVLAPVAVRNAAAAIARRAPQLRQRRGGALSDQVALELRQSREQDHDKLPLWRAGVDGLLATHKLP